MGVHRGDGRVARKRERIGTSTDSSAHNESEGLARVSVDGRGKEDEIN